MTSRLSLSQKTILTAAAARPDGCLLPIPDAMSLRGKSVDRTLASLVHRGLAARTAAEGGGARKEGDAGGPHGVVITPAGRAAIGMAAAGGSEEDSAPKAPLPVGDVPAAEPGGKLGVLLRAISPEQGATLSEIADATNWLGHTTRAALTRLRQRGFDIRLEKIDGRRVYRLHRAA